MPRVPTDFHVNLGDLPTWVAALVAAVAAFFAWRAFRTQAAQLEEQRKVNVAQSAVMDLQAQEIHASLAERERAEAEHERAQALQVYTVDEAYKLGVSASNQHGGTINTTEVHNTSNLPIRNLKIIWHRGTAPWREMTRPYLAPTDFWAERSAIESTEAVPTTSDMLSAVVEFDDAAGRRWRISKDAALDQFVEGRWKRVLGQ